MMERVSYRDATHLKRKLKEEFHGLIGLCQHMYIRNAQSKLRVVALNSNTHIWCPTRNADKARYRYPPLQLKITRERKFKRIEKGWLNLLFKEKASDLEDSAHDKRRSWGTETNWRHGAIPTSLPLWVPYKNQKPKHKSCHTHKPVSHKSGTNNSQSTRSSQHTLQICCFPCYLRLVVMWWWKWLCLSVGYKYIEPIYEFEQDPLIKTITTDWTTAPFPFSEE